MPDNPLQIDNGNFTLTIPKHWETNVYDEILTIIKSDNGVGAIQISSYSIDSDVQFDLFDEFHELITETLNTPLDENWAKDVKQLRENFLVFEATNQIDDRFFISGFCEHNRSILFLTYNCSIADKNVEYKDVHSFLQNITFKNTADT